MDLKEGIHKTDYIGAVVGAHPERGREVAGVLPRVQPIEQYKKLLHIISVIARREHCAFNCPNNTTAVDSCAMRTEAL